MTLVEPRVEEGRASGGEAGPSSPAGPAGPQSPAARWARWLWPLPVLLVVVATVALLPGRGSSGPAPGEAVVTVDGSARIERVDGQAEVVTDGDATLRQGDALDLVSGSATLELAGSVRMQARAGTQLVMGRTPDVRAGDLLVTAAEVTSVTAGGTRIRFVGSDDVAVAGRLVRSAGLSLGVYRGSAELDSAGTTRSLGRLRRVDVPALGEVTGIQPLRFRAGDAWDRRYLADALALDRRLAQVLPGLVRSAQREVGGAEDLASVLGGVDGLPSGATLARLVDPDRKLDDVLVGTAIAGLADGGSFADRWRAAYRFRDSGATWGLVALDQGVPSAKVLRALDAVVRETPLEFETVPAGSGSTEGPGSTGPDGGNGSTPSSSTTAPAGSGGGGGGGGGDTGPVTPTLPPVTLPPTTLPPVPPTTDPLTGIVDGLGDTVGGVVDGVGDTVDRLTEPNRDDGPNCLLGVVCG